jgi:hypothetical protein
MSIDLSKIDLNKLQGDVSGILQGALDGVVEGAKEDLKDYAAAIAKDMLQAQLAGNDEVKAQLLDQLKVLAEINRIRVEAHAWVVVEKVVKVLFSAITAGALAVL